MDIQYSDMQKYLTCGLLWNYSSHLRQNLEPNSTNLNFLFGTLLHLKLEHKYKNKYINLLSDDLKPEDVHKDDYVEIVNKVEHIYYHYNLWQEQKNLLYSDDKFIFEHVELKFKVPFIRNGINILDYDNNQIYLQGTADGLLKHKETGKYYLHEIKTTSRIDDRQEQIAYDMQHDMYISAIEQMLDIEIEGTLYTLITKKEPKPLAILKNGTFSKAKTDCTIFYAKASLLDAKYELDYDDMQELEAMLSNNTAKYFRRIFIKRNQARINYMLDTLYMMVLRIKNNLYAYPATSHVCITCAFKNPCNHKRNGNTEIESNELELYYRQRDNRYAEI